MVNKDNAVFTEMKHIGHAWEERRAAHQEKKQGIIDTCGWDSAELKAWYDQKEADKFPFTQGESKAYRAWASSLSRGQEEMEMEDFLFDSEVHDFIETLRRAGIDSFVYTNTSTAVMENIHAFSAEGYRLEGLCMITRHESRWGTEEPYDVQGIRFTRVW